MMVCPYLLLCSYQWIIHEASLLILVFYWSSIKFNTWGHACFRFPPQEPGLPLLRTDDKINLLNSSWVCRENAFIKGGGSTYWLHSKGWQKVLPENLGIEGGGSLLCQVSVSTGCRGWSVNNMQVECKCREWPECEKQVVEGGVWTSYRGWSVNNRL